jgi:hypothetical protein
MPANSHKQATPVDALVSFLKKMAPPPLPACKRAGAWQDELVGGEQPAPAKQGQAATVGMVARTHSQLGASPGMAEGGPGRRVASDGERCRRLRSSP